MAKQRLTILEQENPGAWQELMQEAERLHAADTPPHEIFRRTQVAYLQALESVAPETRSRISFERVKLWPAFMGMSSRSMYTQDMDGPIPLFNLAGLQKWLNEHYQLALCDRIEIYNSSQLWRIIQDVYLWMEHFTGKVRALPRKPDTVDETKQELSRLRVLVCELAEVEAVGQHDVPHEGGNEPAEESTTDVGRVLELLADDTDQRIADIAAGAGNVHDKMLKILDIDRRFYGFSSRKWAELLSVSEQAVRKTEAWREIQKVKATL